MPQITVRVNDRPYSMVCDEGEEAHLQELAEFLDKEVVNLKENFGQVGDSRLLMMAGIMVADKLSDALSKIETPMPGRLPWSAPNRPRIRWRASSNRRPSVSSN
jgi:cell division protein ZapA (FtsZ GTPase activity inhibitor)